MSEQAIVLNELTKHYGKHRGGHRPWCARGLGQRLRHP